MMTTLQEYAATSRTPRKLTTYVQSSKTFGQHTQFVLISGNDAVSAAEKD
jgi:hypothetical protein